MIEFGPHDIALDTVTDLLSLPFDERPVSSSSLAHREASRTVRNILEHALMSVSRLAVPLTRVLVEATACPELTTAAVQFDLNSSKAGNQRSATGGLMELDTGRKFE